MKRVKLSPRLNAIVQLIDASMQTVADVGCDHGRLSVALLQGGQVLRVIASDVSEASVAKTMALKAKCGIGEALSVHLANGLEALRGEAPDCIILAGLGGISIAEILRADREIAAHAKRVILQPMRGIGELRRFLFENGYCILEDRLVSDAGRIYQVISAVPGVWDERPAGWPEDMYDVGWRSVEAHDPLLAPYLGRIRAAYARELAGAKGRGGIPKGLIDGIGAIDAVLNLAIFRAK